MLFPFLLLAFLAQVGFGQEVGRDTLLIRIREVVGRRETEDDAREAARLKAMKEALDKIGV